MPLIDHTLTYLGVRSITPIKELWLLVSLLICAAQLTLAWSLRRVPELWGLAAYLVTATMRDTCHYWSWWDWSLESTASAFALLAAVESAMRATFWIRTYQRTYARHMTWFVAAGIVLIALWQMPKAYTGFSPSVYYIRLYIETACAALLGCSLVYVWWNHQQQPQNI